MLWHHKIYLPRFKFNCPLCPYGSNVLTQIKKHKSVHVSDRPYDCSVCNNWFEALNSLNSHLLLHNGEKANYL